MKNITKAMIVLLGLAGIDSLAAIKTMGVPQYATARSVKVCAQSESGMACGTGSFVGKGIILTENHIIADQEDIFIDTTTNRLGLKTSKVDRIMVLKSDEQQFTDAVLVRKDENKDLAILQIVDDVNPQVILNLEFSRGQEVWAIGNPGGEDFRTVKTRIKGIRHFNYRNGIERDMLEFDSKDNTIRAGFSGGGIYNLEGGLVGILEMCSEEQQSCLAISSSDVKHYLEEVK